LCSMVRNYTKINKMLEDDTYPDPRRHVVWWDKTTSMKHDETNEGIMEELTELFKP